MSPTTSLCILTQMLNVAIEAAKAAGNLALKYNKSRLNIQQKKDLFSSPVTQADKDAEQLIRTIINRKFPDHGIIGEEFGQSKPNAEYQWIIDPIDGTRDYVRQNPFWSTLIAVLKNQKPIIGVCYFPNSRQLFHAQTGKGAFINGKKNRVSEIAILHKAYVNISSPHQFKAAKKEEQLFKLSKSVGASRYFSSMSYAMLWQRQAEALVVAGGSIWDFAATSIITEEAGGKFTDFNGNYALDSGTAVFSNGKIHEQILKILNDK